MPTSALEKLGNPKVLIVLLAVITAIISIQNYLVIPNPNGSPTQELTLYSNYLIFKNSFFHLIHHQNLYIFYSSERVDFFKYSPTFALLMTPFAIFPNLPGLFLWNFLNLFILYLAIWKLPIAPQKRKLLALLLIVMEAITAMQNSQSNSLIAGLIILAFVSLEKNKTGLAALLIVITVFIKIFGGVAFILFLLYPNKLKASIYTALWFAVLTLLPLLVVTPGELVGIYKSWWTLLSSDYNGSEGLSVMAWIDVWFGITNCKLIVVLIGFILFCIPLLRYRQFHSQHFRLLILASTLLWIIIFNHKAESPTFVIAVSGLVIWFYSQTASGFNTVLLLLALVFTILSPTDIFPAHVRNDIFIPYVVKVVPCILIWFKLTYDLLRSDFRLTLK